LIFLFYKETAGIFMDKVEIISQIADVKEYLYRTTLGLTSLIESLIDKGVLTREDLLSKANELELELLFQPDSNHL
jgi:hypothetical protein